EVDGEPVQVVLPAGPRPLPAVDLRGLPAGAREREARRLAAGDARRPFDLARGPLLRTALLHLAEGEHALLANMHHVVGDAWSTGVLTRELSALYAAAAEGRPSPLPPLPVQYGDFAAWQRGWLVGEALERQIACWRERLAGAPPLLELPTDHPRPAVASPRGGAAGLELPDTTAAALRALARGEGATPYAVLLAGFAALLGRYADADDVPVGTAIAGRNRLETEPLVGFFVNTLVIRADLSGDPTARALVGQARERTLEAHAHQDLPFERLVDELRVERSRAHSPLFQAMFNFNAAAGGGGEGLRLGGVRVRPMGAAGGTEKFDLTLSVTDTGERFGGALSYRAELWEAATIERMLGHYAALLEGMAREPDRPVSAVPLLPETERAQVLEGWNATRRGYPAGLRVHDLFAAQAARTPGAAAVSWRGERTSYGELERRANRLAHALRRRGVGPETRVGIFLGRTPELVVALLGVLKAGGAYVPLDPAYPAERLEAMAEDAGVALVLTEARLRGGLPPGVGDALVLDRELEALAREPDDAPESGVLPENLSHVIFTSGSTGRPKGVMIRHSSVVVLLHWLRETVSDEERASVLFSTSVSFDVSVAELFGTLCWGGKLVLVENALELPDVAEPVAHASMVPSAAAELLRSGGIPGSVRTLNLGGEALPHALAQALYALEHVEKVGNLYGPTEDTTYSTYSRVERGGEQVFVGRPVADTRAYVLDRHLGPVPAGVIGELYLAGAGLARGYARRPDLTAERFLPDPFGEPGSRMYRVMDRVRWRMDGQLEYFGRTDFQVKVRGFRIELGEVETVLAAHPEVRECVAVVREDAPGDRRIVAYVVPAGGGPGPDAGELRAHAGRRLPGYMVPAVVVALERLPLSPNGKVDRRALPAPPRAESGEGGSRAPRDTLEMTLARIFAEVLGVEEVGPQDDFFELGGHSLLAVRLVGEVQKAAGVRLPVAALFGAPTVERLAAEVRRGGGETPLLVPVRPGGSRPPLFLVHPVGGSVVAYAALARGLDAGQPVYGLRSRGTEPGETPNWTVEEMAREYLAAVRGAQLSGPYRLGGWSMGGVIAFEMARQLEAAGERAEKLVLIDSQAPALHDRGMPQDPVALVQTFAQDMGFPAELLADPTPETREAGELPYLREVLDTARAAGLLPPELELGRIEHLYGIFKINLQALYEYRPESWGGRATLVRAGRRGLAERLFEKRTLGWERVVRGGIELRSSPGDHFAMVREPHAGALAREVQRALDG
ncbi:MAG TPA: amino acid adenylation domain-containing protein, partial [Longimicrobiaceae bacterium]|nr:amino acid adenylation domain-containing protein [Longimicrobiaceae bacterium]